MCECDGGKELDCGVYIYSIPSWHVHLRWYNESGASVTIQQVALYEGEYTAETLPEYQPKGYGAELLECMRYYQQSFVGTPQNAENLHIVIGANVNWASTVNFPVPMRCVPTVAIYDYVTGNVHYMSKWATDEPVSDVTVGCVGTKSFNPLKSGGLITNLSYGLHYTASADL